MANKRVAKFIVSGCMQVASNNGLNGKQQLTIKCNLYTTADCVNPFIVLGESFKQCFPCSTLITGIFDYNATHNQRNWDYNFPYIQECCNLFMSVWSFVDEGNYVKNDVSLTILRLFTPEIIPPI